MVRNVIALLLLVLAPLAAKGQIMPLSEQSRVSLLTVLPGDAIYSMYGHSAFRVYDPVYGIDHTFNYGTFEFGNPILFSLKFMYGKLDYRLSAFPFDRAMLEYREYERRPVIEQVLNLSLEERMALFEYLQVNLLPENRYYRYDFLFDNCSTRIRDVLEKAIPGKIRFPSDPQPEPTFRQLLKPYAANRPFLDAGYDLLLGMPVDRHATERETVFLPLRLMAMFDRASILQDGAYRPLVTSRDTVFWIEGRDVVRKSPPYPTILGWLLFAVGLGATIVAYRKGNTGKSRWDAVLFVTVGVVGCLIAFLWFISEHYVANNNWNMAWAWPTHLVAGILIALRRPLAPWLTYYFRAMAAVGVLLAAAWFFLPQQMHPALLPIALLVTLRAGWLGRGNAKMGRD